MIGNTLLNKKTELVINSQPRSGSNFLINEILGTLSIKDDRIYHTHDAELFNDKRYNQVAIIRDPAESLISLCAMFRFFEKIPLTADIDAKDVPGIHRFQVAKSNISIQINFLKDFLNNLNNNFDSVLTFTFEEVTTNTDHVIKLISDKYNINFKNKTNKNTDFYDNLQRQFLKSSKDLKHYEVLKNNIYKHQKEIDELYNIYNECLRKIKIDS
jgi:hypothetical protein